MADYSGFNPTIGSTDYVPKFTAFLDATELVATEVENARQGQATLLANLQRKFDMISGATANLNMGGFRITNGVSAVNPSDYTTLSQVNSLITTGGNPEDVAITDLNVGTVQDGQLVGRVGSAIVGVTPAVQSEIDSIFKASML